MNISELKSGSSKVEIEGEIVSIDETREINKYGRKLRVANATIKDDSGSITLTLWNEDIDKVKAGDKILFGKYSGTEIKIDGEEHLILREDDVLAIMED